MRFGKEGVTEEGVARRVGIKRGYSSSYMVWPRSRRVQKKEGVAVWYGCWVQHPNGSEELVVNPGG